MKFAPKALIATLMMITAATTVAASPADLTIFPKESSTEINSFTSYEVTVENVGPVKDVYSLSSKGKEVSIAPRKVELEPGAEETVNVWYNPEMDKEEGTYSFTVTASSRANGKRYSVDGVVNVIKDHDVAVSLDRASKTGCLNEKVTYTVSVTNNGIQKENYQLTTEYGKLARNEVSLEEGETETVKLVATSSRPVQENFNVVAASKTSYAQDIQNVEYNSEICYASEVSVTPQNKKVAANTNAEFEVTVRNTGTKADEFVLSATRGNLDDTKIDIDGKSSESTTLTVAPEKLGKKKVTVTAKSTVTSTGTATMNVFNGNDAEISLNGNRAVCETQKAEYEVTLENTGAAGDTYKISSNRGKLSNTEVTIPAGSSETVDLKVDATQLEEGKTHSVSVTAKSQTFKKPKVTGNAKLRVKNCWDLDMNVVPEVASAGENRSVIYEVQLDNPGTEENTYRLAYEGPSWVEIKPSEVTVQPGERGTAFIYAGIPFEKRGEVKITATAVGNNVEDSKTVQLIVDEDIEEAIKSKKRSSGLIGGLGDSITGAFSEATSAGTGVKLLVSVVIGGLITLAVLLREL